MTWPNPSSPNTVVPPVHGFILIITLKFESEFPKLFHKKKQQQHKTHKEAHLDLDISSVPRGTPRNAENLNELSTCVLSQRASEKL